MKIQKKIFLFIYFFLFFFGGGGGSGQGECERRSEAFVKIQKNIYIIFFFLVGGWW